MPIDDRSKVQAGAVLVSEYYGQKYTCHARSSGGWGGLVFDVQDRGEFQSISSTASGVRAAKGLGKTVNANGWAFWSLSSEDEGGAPRDKGVSLPDTTSSMLFSLELHLEDFMETNWERIDLGGLAIWKDNEGRSGRQYRTSIGPIDFLCTDANGNFVVIELKRGRPSDDVVGQIARYMGWVQEHLAAGKSVRGISPAHEDDDERLRYALKVLPSVQGWAYRVNFELHRESYQ